MLQLQTILDRINTATLESAGSTPTDISIQDTQHQVWAANEYLGSDSHINTNYACTVTVELDFDSGFTHTVRFATYDEYDEFMKVICVDRIKRACKLLGVDYCEMVVSVARKSAELGGEATESGELGGESESDATVAIANNQLVYPRMLDMRTFHAVTKHLDRRLASIMWDDYRMFR